MCIYPGTYTLCCSLLYKMFKFNLFIYICIPLLAYNGANANVKTLLPNYQSFWIAAGRYRVVQWEYIPDHNGTGDEECIWDIELRNLDDSPVYITRITNEDDIDINERLYTYKLLLPDHVVSGQYRICITRTVGESSSTYKSKRFSVMGGDAFEGPYHSRKGHVKRLEKWHQKQKQYYSSRRSDDVWSFSRDHCMIPRLHKPSKDEFLEKCALAKKACIVTGLAENWPAMTKWRFENLPNDPRLTKGVRVSSLKSSIPLRVWDDYRRNSSSQESGQQTMVFMSDFFDAYPAFRKDYSVPGLFDEEDDFMSKVPDDLRIDWRWLILGIRLSGSHWHTDPVNTTAWLALIEGAKLWGVYPKERFFVPGTKNNRHQVRDYAMVDAYNWWRFTYPALKTEEKPLTCVQREGDIIYLPAGTWHSVLNLEDTVAVTQNAITKINFDEATKEMRAQAVFSGKDSLNLGDVFEELRYLYQTSHPDLFDDEALAFASPITGSSTDEYEQERREHILSILTEKSKS